MMEEVRQYVLSVVVVSIICALVRKIVEKGTPFGSIVHVICGFIIAITVLSPWVSFKLEDISLFPQGLYAQAQKIADSGMEAAEKSTNELITEQTETYILDKAISLGLNVSVEVELDDSKHIPNFVTIGGDVSPYAKNVLSDYIESTLAITEENLKWI